MDEQLNALAGVLPDEITHITIKNSRICRDKCPVKPCTFICPTLVFRWDEEESRTDIDYRCCVECGACAPACPRDNIDLSYPRGGYGKVLHV